MPSLNSDEIIIHIDEIKKEIIYRELKKILEEKYNLWSKKIEKSEESTDGNVYIIDCENKKFVVKIYDNLEHTKSMVKLHTKLSSLNMNIPKIITTKESESYVEILHSNYIVIYSFIEGEQIVWNKKTGKLEKNLIKAIARKLRKLHHITNKNEFNLPTVPFENYNKRQSVVHFDLTRNNIFINNDNEIGIIDCDDAKYGDAICDVSILIANLFFSKTRGVDLEGMQEFIEEYYIDEPNLKKEEEPLIKEYAKRWIKYILNGNEFDTSTTESFEIRYKLIEENL